MFMTVLTFLCFFSLFFSLLLSLLLLRFPSLSFRRSLLFFLGSSSEDDELDADLSRFRLSLSLSLSRRSLDRERDLEFDLLRRPSLSPDRDRDLLLTRLLSGLPLLDRLLYRVLSLLLLLRIGDRDRDCRSSPLFRSVSLAPLSRSLSRSSRLRGERERSLGICSS